MDGALLDIRGAFTPDAKRQRRNPMHAPNPPLRILVVDDHADSVDMLKVILSQDGYDVTGADSYKEAVRLALASHFDLLITDIVMPDHDGVELFKVIRSVYPIRSIALTGGGMPLEVRRVADAGFDECLVKPVDLDQLRSTINNLHA